MTHSKDITTLNEEIIMLKNLVEHMTLQFSISAKKVESNEQKKTEDIKAIESAPLEPVF